MNQLRAAVIGTGLIGTMHARAYDEFPDVDLVAVVDQDEARARSLARELGVTAHRDATSLFEHHALDLVSIATPEQHRLEPTRLAMEHRVAILLEKPLGTNLAAVDELVALVDGYEPPIGVNFILHADDRYATMRDEVRAGEVGRLASTFARRRGTKLGIAKYAPWTNLLRSTAIHDIDMMLSIHPSPITRVYAEGVRRLCAPYGSEDAVVATLKFADGSIASLDTSWTLPATQAEPLDPAFHVVGDEGGIFIDGSSHGMRIMTASHYGHPDMTHWPLLPFGVGGAFANAVRHFVRTVRDGGAPLTTVRQARRSHVVVDALERSMAEERPIPIDDAFVQEGGDA